MAAERPGYSGVGLYTRRPPDRLEASLGAPRFDREGRLLTVVGGTGVDPGEFGLPAGICIDSSNRILIADSANHRIQILRYLGEPEKTGGGS